MSKGMLGTILSAAGFVLSLVGTALIQKQAEEDMTAIIEEKTKTQD